MKNTADNLESQKSSAKDPYLINENLVWWTYPKTTKWKLAQRDKLDEDDKDLIDGINITTIIDSACFVEGTVNEILNEAIYTKSFPYTNEFNSRLIDLVEEKLENAQWTDYVKIFEVVFGFDLRKEINQTLWKGISALFTFRNMLVHGKPITIEFYERSNDKCEIKVPKKYHSVFQYLLERKLIHQFYSRDETNVDLISSSICDHFFYISKTFIREVLKLVPFSDKEDIEENILDSLNAGD